MANYIVDVLAKLVNGKTTIQKELDSIKGLSVNVNDIKVNQQQAQKTGQQVSKAVSKNAKVDMTISTTKAQSEIAKLNNYLTKNTAITKNAKTQITAWINEYGKGNVAKSRVQEINAEFKTLDSQMRSMGKLGNSLTTSFKNQAQKFAQWVSISGAVLSAWHEVQNGTKFIGELDDALTNINFTMDVSKSDLKEIGDSSIDMAKNLQTSASNVLGAVKLYANANETTQSILDKAQPAIMLSNATGLSGENSAKYLQTIMNQFDMSQDDLMGITDIIENISQNLAHDFSDGIVQMNDAISDSGSVAKAAGLDLKDYASIIGVLVEKTGLQGSQLGNSMKTKFF